jgi:hypothetical protein
VRLEAAYDIGWLRAWFEAWADFLLSWDPFHYDISIGVRLGADFHIRIDLFFGTIDVHFSISVGASLRVVGPPLHGEVTAELGPIGLTVPFGDDATGEPDALPWGVFRDKYILSGDPAAIPVTAQPESGFLPPASGQTPPDGSADKPWVFAAEFSFSTRTAMPATEWRGPTDASAITESVSLDIAPMHESQITSTHRTVIEKRDGSVVTLDPDRFKVSKRLGDFPEAIWNYEHGAGPNAAARNVSGVAGLDVEVVAEVSTQKTGEIDVAHLVDIGESKELPFNRQTSDWRHATVEQGQAAEALGSQFKELDAKTLLAAGSPAHAGLPIRAAAMSGRSLAAFSARISAPRVAPLSEGMTLLPPARGIPAVVAPAPLPAPERPPLRLVDATRFSVTAVAPIASTSVSNSSLPRRAPPRVSSSKVGRLLRVASTTQPPPTSASLTPPRLGAGPAAVEARELHIARAEKDGVDLAAGAVHTWDIDPNERWSLALRGDAARIVAFDRSGKAVLDVEFTADTTSQIALPLGSTRVAVWSLGRAPLSIRPGFGSVSTVCAARTPAAVGWHEGSLLHMVLPTRGLGRGCRLRTSRASQIGLRRAAEIVAETTTLETELPASVDAVIVGALVTAGVAARDALEVGIVNARYGMPLPFETDHGRATIYPVRANGPVTVTVVRGGGLRLASVVGVRGHPEELAAALHGKSIASVLAEPPLGALGGVHIRFERGQR